MNRIHRRVDYWKVLIFPSKRPERNSFPKKWRSRKKKLDRIQIRRRNGERIGTNHPLTTESQSLLSPNGAALDTGGERRPIIHLADNAGIFYVYIGPSEGQEGPGA